MGYECFVEAESELTIMKQAEPSDVGGGKGSQDPKLPSKGKSTGKGDHGGWMPRVASLIDLYRAKKWSKLERLHETYIKMSQPLAKLLGGTQ